MSRLTTLLAGGGRAWFRYTAVVGAGQTTTPKFTFAAGAPAAVVDWGDGTAQSPATSGVELSHAYTNAGSYLVSLIMPRQDLWLTQIDVNTDYARFSTSILRKLKKLTHLICYGGSNGITGPVSGLPVGLTFLNCEGGNNAITGPVSGLPVGLTYLSCGGGSNGITGPVSGLPVGLTYLICGGGSNGITGPVSGLPVGLTYLACYGGSNGITGPVSGLPVGLTYLICGGGSNGITGPVSGLPVGLTFLACEGGNNAITGPVSGLPVGLTYLSCGGGSNGITGPVSDLPVNIQTVYWYGASNIPSAGAPPSKIRRLEIQGNALNQATVDAILLAMYAARATYTYATPVLNIGGTNAAPSGTYADEDPPTTGKAAAYELVNDPEGEGYNKWTITFTT